VSAAFDVVVLGEVLLEITTDSPLGHGVPATVGVSGDALNVAAAAAATGARVGLVSVLPDDDTGRAVAERIEALGVSPALLHRTAGQQGVYFSHVDPNGQREFSYVRAGSAGSTLSPAHLDADVLASVGAVVSSGITCAISETARAAVLAAAGAAGRFVYDPNFRPRLTTAERALADLRALAPHCALITPSHPAETTMLGRPTPAATAAELLALGAGAVAVTCGSEGVHVQDATGTGWVDAVPAPAVVDQTGAGDSFVGSVAARLVAGDDLRAAVRYAVGAASLAVGGRGGTGLVPTRDQVLAHLAGAGR